MFTRTALLTQLALALVCSAVLFGQQPATTRASASPESSAAQEFPVFLEQNLTAGKTKVGSKVTAKLEVATLMNGTVIPRYATFTGEVIESTAKTATEPSRLAIRMNSVQWKKGSTPIQVYLTPWYYPTVDEMGQDLRYGPQQSAKGTWNGQGQYPDSNSKVYRPFPGSDSQKDNGGGAPDTPAATASNRRVLMKNVECVHSDAGTIAIVSKTANLKLDKLTNYVLATGDLLPPK
jgi:hypothetical protein